MISCRREGTHRAPRDFGRFGPRRLRRPIFGRFSIASRRLPLRFTSLRRHHRQLYRSARADGSGVPIGLRDYGHFAGRIGRWLPRGAEFLATAVHLPRRRR